MALEREFYTADQLADLLAVSRKTVDRIVRRGALPVYCIGRVRRFRRDGVEAFLACARTDATLDVGTCTSRNGAVD